MTSATHPRPIRPLPEILINQIAAGEVVERPASVVRLVENAIDAGASRVDIDLEEGGVRLIRIRDNGSGIAPEQLPLAVSRHATSKIADLDDLESVATLGFRGEALPSIGQPLHPVLAARATTSTFGADRRRQDRRGDPRAHAPGTTVEVRELFYNVPARRKFLRAERTELGHIEEWLRSLALARPDVELRVSHNGRPRGATSQAICIPMHALPKRWAGFRQPGRARGPQRRRPAPAWLDCAAALFARERRPAVPVRQRSLSA